MKQYIFIFVLIMPNIASFGQKVVGNSVKDNIRTIETSEIAARSFTDRVIWLFALEAYQNLNDKDDVKYVLIVTLNAMTEIPISDDGVFLIKTFNDSILELTSIHNGHNTVTLGYSYHRPILGNVGTVSANNMHRNTANFIITEKQIKALKEGVKKGRLETDDGFQEKEYKKDKCGEFIFHSYEIISSEMSKTPKSVKDNF